MLNYISTEPRATYRWDHSLDFTNWRASTWGGSWIDDPYDQRPTARTQQSGRYWLHANTKVGQSTDIGGNGVHTKLDGTEGKSLANHYERSYPVVVTPHIEKAPLSWGANGRFFPIDPCLGPSCYELNPCVGGDCEGPCLTCELGKLSDFDPYEIRVLGAIEGDGIGVLTRGGGIAQVDARTLSAGAKALLEAPGNTVLRAVEPNRNIGQGASLAQALVLDAATFRVVERLDVRGPSLYTRSEIRGPSTEQGRLLAPPIPAPPPADLAGRTKAVTVYSSAIGRAFVVGGQSASGQQLHDVWSLSLDQGADQWVPLSLSGVPLGSVLAATYAYADNQIWVLDEIKGFLGLKLARLLRVDATTGATTLVGAWLGLDRDGSILLSASSSRLLGAHKIVRIATGTPKVTGVLAGLRALVMAPLVDRGGYTLVGPKRPGSAASLDVRRTETLPMGQGNWGHLGGCL